MAGFGLDHLLDPLVGGDFLSSVLPLLMERREQQQTRSDPNILGFINNLIGEYNASNAYNPATGQFNAGSPFGDAASGHGGAYGHDRNGNPLSPFQFSTQYGLSQLQGSQAGLDAGIGNLGRVAEQAGVAAPQGFSLNVPSGIDPGAVQGVDQGVRVPPGALSPLAPAGGLLAGGGGGLLGMGLGQGGGRNLLQNFVGSFAVGTTSVPRTGLAQVHQGEAIVPASQNPMAGGPSLPLAPQGPQAARAGMAGGGMPSPPSYQPLTPGLSPQVQAQIVNRGQEGIDAQFQGIQRDLRNQGAMSGQGNTGALARRMFDAELARSGQVAGLQRDVGLEAANRQFTDSLAANNFGLQRYLGEGGLGLQQGQLALQGELGRGQLGQGQQALDLQGEIQRGQLGQGQQRLDLERYLGEGGLGVQQGQLALQGELGRGQLGNETLLAQLQQELGRGQLGQGQQRIDLERLLGEGQLGQGQQRIDLDRMLGQGQLGQGQQRIDLDRLLGQGQLGQGQQRIDLDRLLGQGQLGQGQQRIDLDRMLGQGELSLRGELGRGQLANDVRGLDIQQLLGEGNLANDRYGLETGRTLGQGELGRNLANDAFGQYQYGQTRNDSLAQQDFQNQFQQWAAQNNQNQFGQLLGLLSQFPGQAAGGAGGDGNGVAPGAPSPGFRPLGGLFQDLLGGGGQGGQGGGGGGGFAPFGGFFQNLFGRN